MSTIDLFILGFIKEKSCNAYELALFIKKNKFDELLKISSPAVYKNLIKLAKNGYLSVKNIKDSLMPERKVYSITKKGEEYHIRLLNQVFEKDLKYYFDFNVGILNLSMIEKEKGIKYLESLKEDFEKKKILINESIKKYHFIPIFGLTIMHQQQMINNAMINWINEFINQYKEYKGKKGLNFEL
jgi:DNA-binding PadR family transcriptional regulator